MACYSEINKYLAGSSINESNDSALKTGIKIESHGLYECATVTASSKSDSTRVKYILGSQPQNIFNNALVWSYPNLRASYTGNVNISGNILATSDKIKTGKIRGINGYDKTIAENQIYTSDSIKTKYYNSQIIDQIYAQYNSTLVFDTTISGDLLFDKNQFPKSQNYKVAKILGDLTINGNFEFASQNKQYKFYSTGSINCARNTKIRNSIFYTSESIAIEPNCEFNDCIFITEGSLTVQENCKLKNIQIFTRKNISITGSNFLYPSVIAMYTNTKDSVSRHNKLEIKQSNINGTVLMLCSSVGEPNNKSRIIVDSSSKIQGLCYSENEMLFQGTMYGTIYTYKFWYSKEPTQYVNWMVDTKIEREKLSDYFLLPIGFGEISSKSILKEEWIY